MAHALRTQPPPPWERASNPENKKSDVIDRLLALEHDDSSTTANKPDSSSPSPPPQPSPAKQTNKNKRKLPIREHDSGMGEGGGGKGNARMISRGRGDAKQKRGTRGRNDRDRPGFVSLEVWREMRQSLRSCLRIGEWALNVATGKIWWSTMARKILYIQPSWGGKGHDASSLKRFSLLLHPEDRNFVLTLFNRAITLGVPFDVSTRVLTEPPNSVQVWADIVAASGANFASGGNATETSSSTTETIANSSMRREDSSAPSSSAPTSSDDNPSTQVRYRWADLESDQELTRWCRIMCRVQFHTVTKRVEKLLGTVQDISSWARSVKPESPVNQIEQIHDQSLMVSNEDHIDMDEDQNCLVS